MNISIEEMPRELERLLEENERLQDRIDKAIEYMQNIHWFDLRNNEGLQLYATDKNFWNELSNILKGNDK